MPKAQFCLDEIRLFYLWLQGQIEESKQKDNLLIVFVCCPAERDTLLKEFLTEFHNEGRYRLLRNNINHLMKGSKAV